MSTAQKKQNQELSYTLKKTQHVLRMQMDKALKPLNLTTPQYAVLSQLKLKPGISNAALARVSFVTAQTMHGIVTNLEKMNLVKRKCDPSHGRILCTELTKKGLAILSKALLLIHSVEEAMTSSLTDKNKVLLEKLLLDCINNFE
jgi:DNA-binding MarR family transcriptional regulator